MAQCPAFLNMQPPATGNRVYVGLAATLHDPAIALVASDGRPVFAESTERALQSKRAFNCPPDDLVRAPRLLREYFPDAREVVAAVSWSSGFLAGLDAQLVGQAPPYAGPPEGWTAKIDWPLPHPMGLSIGLRNSISLAGMNLWASSRLCRNGVNTAV